MLHFPDPVRSRAILIGVSDYEHSDNLSNLPAIRNNLVALEKSLTDSMTGVFSREHCTVADSPDSPRTFMQRLARAAGEAEDTLLVYYAGHGVLGWNGDLHLTVRESDDRQIAGTAVPFEWVRSAIKESPALIRIIVLDCCFSGRAIGAMSSDSAALEQVDVEGTTILTSTTATQISHSIPGEEYTAFTGELIKILGSDRANSLSLSEVYRPLTAAMASRGLPRPKIVIGDTAGQLALRRGAATARPLQQNAAGPIASEWRSPAASPLSTPPRAALPYQAAAGFSRVEQPVSERTQQPVVPRRFAGNGAAIIVARILLWPLGLYWLWKRRNTLPLVAAGAVALFTALIAVTGIIETASGAESGSIAAAIIAIVMLSAISAGFFAPIVRAFRKH